jgi:hypothetical protein
LVTLLFTTALAAPPVLETSSPAPNRAWAGLEFGVTDEAALDKWVAERGLTCDKVPSPRRETTHLRCENPDPRVFGEQTGPGVVTDLLIVRTDTGPVHHVSFTREVPDEAALDVYARAVDDLTRTYGPPTRATELPPSLVGRIVSARTDWHFQDLDVRVSMMRLGDKPLRIAERWDVPGVEALVAERPGSVGAHGSGSSSAKNPHLED